MHPTVLCIRVCLCVYVCANNELFHREKPEIYVKERTISSIKCREDKKKGEFVKCECELKTRNFNSKRRSNRRYCCCYYKRQAVHFFRNKKKIYICLDYLLAKQFLHFNFKNNMINSPIKKYVYLNSWQAK